MATAFSSVARIPDQTRSVLPVLGDGALPSRDEALVRRAALAAKPKAQDLEDVQQAVLEEYCRKVPSYDSTTGVPLHGYLWPHLVGAARHIVRADPDVRKKNGLGFEVPAEDIALFDTPTESGAEIDPLTSREVQRFVRGLEDITRYIVVCRYWHDISLTQIAEEVGMRPQSVQRRLDKAMGAGRNALFRTYMGVAA